MINIGNIGITNIFLGSTQVSKAYLGNIQVWPTESNYVTFTAQQANSTIGLSKLSTNQTLEYSTDKVNWLTFDTSVTITLANVGDEVYIRGVLSGNNTSSNYTRFTMTGLIAASGNCNSLWNYEDLNATLKEYCGYFMFSGCTSLTTAPESPAATLTTYCYAYMFDGCSSLTAAPELPATTLANDCYYGMFYGCTRLNYIKCLAVNGINQNNSTNNWTYGVSANGTFVKDPSASWPTGTNGIPSGWNVQDA